MKILFVSHVPEHYVKDREPLGIMSLSASLKLAGHETRLCLPRIRDMQQVLKDFPARIIAYSISTGYHNFYLRFNEHIRKMNKNIISVFGGPHATFMPDFIEQNDFVEAVCRGEGDDAFVEFIERYESNGDYHLTPNFYVRRDGTITRNMVRNLEDDLDTLPFPDRELVYDLSTLARKNKIKNFITMRGCPYHCSHCFNCRYNEIYKSKGKVLRRRSVDKTIEEILDVKSRYPLELVYFRDDTFLLFSEWIEEFSRHYKRMVNLPFVCTARLDLVTEKIAADLRNANCVSVEAGIEAGNDHIRNQVLERNMSEKRILEGAQILRSHNIKILAENLLGVPGSTLKNELETYSLNKKCSVYYINAQVLQPYFGTKVYDYAESLNFFNQSVHDMKPESVLGKSMLALKHKKQRERLQRIMPVCGKFRLPIWLVYVLIYLPLQPIYSLVHVIFKGYAGKILYPFRTTRKEQIHIIIQLFSQHHLFETTEDKWIK